MERLAVIRGKMNQSVLVMFLSQICALTLVGVGCIHPGWQFVCVIGGRTTGPIRPKY